MKPLVYGIFLLLVLVPSGPTLAEDTPAAYTPPIMDHSLPRMLSRVNKRRSRSYRRRSSRVARAPRKTFYRRAVIRRSGKRWGLQLAGLGKQQNSNGGLLGLLPAIGMRGYMDFPLVGNLIFEPSFGILVSSQGIAELNTTQIRFEPGINILYSPNPVARLRWQIGVANKFDVILSRIRAFEDSSAGLGLGYRVGPITGIAVKTGTDSSFTLDFGWTFDVLNQGRSHIGLSAGLAFWL